MTHFAERRRVALIQEGLCPCDEGPLSPENSAHWRVCGPCGCWWKIDAAGRAVVSRMGIHRTEVPTT